MLNSKPSISSVIKNLSKEIKIIQRKKSFFIDTNIPKDIANLFPEGYWEHDRNSDLSFILPYTLENEKEIKKELHEMGYLESEDSHYGIIFKTSYGLKRTISYIVNVPIDQFGEIVHTNFFFNVVLSSFEEGSTLLLEYKGDGNELDFANYKISFKGNANG